MLAVALLTPSAAFATPSAIESKQAERDEVLTDIEQMRTDLAARTREYVELCKKADQTRAEVEQVSAEIETMDGELQSAETAFTERAVQIYRRDNGGLLELLLSSDNVEQFMKRAYYLVVIGEYDSSAITRLRQARSENLWLQQSLSNRVAELERLQQSADDARESIEDEVKDAEDKAAQIGEEIDALAATASAATYSGSDPDGAFVPELVISEAKFRNTAPMTVEQIQAFLESQPGTLDTYRAKDHSGDVKSTAEMVFDAATEFNISAQVILVKLQKEQSLLADSSPSQRQLNWAMGCGKTDSRTLYQYEGFGNQIWWGAQKLDKNSRPWSAGISLKIDGNTINPANSATYSLYKYTPHFSGTRSFWMLYWRYFGDPM